MGALTFELAARSEDRQVQAVDIQAHPESTPCSAQPPGWGAAGHDFCAVSLSDLMTPWSVIERGSKAASADFVVCFYNPVSRSATATGGGARHPAHTGLPSAGDLRQIGRVEKATPIAIWAVGPAEVDMFCMVMVTRPDPALPASQERPHAPVLPAVA